MPSLHKTAPKKTILDTPDARGNNAIFSLQIIQREMMHVLFRMGLEAKTGEELKEVVEAISSQSVGGTALAPFLVSPIRCPRYNLPLPIPPPRVPFKDRKSVYGSSRVPLETLIIDNWQDWHASKTLFIEEISRVDAHLYEAIRYHARVAKMTLHDYAFKRLGILSAEIMDKHPQHYARQRALLSASTHYIEALTHLGKVNLLIGGLQRSESPERRGKS